METGDEGIESIGILMQTAIPDTVLDETITNTALVLLLDTVLGLAPSAGCEFTMFRVAFESNFRQAGYKALTDGALWINGDEEDIRAILEVKKGRRYENYDRIRMQETAELVVGWLKKSYKPWNELFNGQQDSNFRGRK
ncbi:hypothetical protein BDV36DRAFT_298254 [Aspergillus pseudocaelatus]|uniref:Uncharacterized protein n=1 Tax=Aspergillus pseudocaelatus TaxID=1825620 RepID=A0ABQ6WE58_9EURO|nr:hypothetical protein BDV36DRAFT_298254 [Aspergillus pseudocaelatus]